MNRTRRLAGFAVVAGLCLVLGSGQGASARSQAAAQGSQETGKQQYTMPEYNCYTAARDEKNPAQQVKLLDDCVAKFPNSALLVYEYPLYFQAYSQLKNFPKVMEYSDKLIALGDKADVGVRYQALYARAFAYNSLNINEKDPSARDQATKARDAAQLGLKTLDELKKPENMTDEDFKKQKQQPMIMFNFTAANASMTLKDYDSAAQFYKAVLALTPDDALTNYRLGLAYMKGKQPPELTSTEEADASWAFARAVTAKNANQQQSNQIKSYLRRVIANYQGGNVCDSITDAELNELLQLAGSSAERPASYKLPSSADLDAARKDMTIASVISDLKGGGDKAKVTWLASCGLEFPDVQSKLLEVVPGGTPNDPVTLKLAFVTSQAEFDAATTPNMDVKIVAQPEAAKLDKDNTPAPRFTGTLVSYDPDPFMLHWDKAKVNPEDIPKAKPAPKRPVRRPPRKPPGR